MSSDEEVSTMEIHTTMSKDRIRRLTKPLMEKRRRARINSCLNQLKTLVLEAMNQNTSHFSKLEKADILEMTVKHLCQLQRRQAESQKQLEGCCAARFRAGYTECAQEVARCLATVDTNDTTMTVRVMQHLSTRIQLPVPFDSQTPPVLYPHLSAQKSCLRQSPPCSTMYFPVTRKTNTSPSSVVFPQLKPVPAAASVNLQTNTEDVKPVLNTLHRETKTFLNAFKCDSKPDLNKLNRNTKSVLNAVKREVEQVWLRQPVKSELKSGNKCGLLRNVNNNAVSPGLFCASGEDLPTSPEGERLPMPSADGNPAEDVWRPW